MQILAAMADKDVNGYPNHVHTSDIGFRMSDPMSFKG